jgi:hypothetical protein
MLTGESELTRTVALNLAAVRDLRAGADTERTSALQGYILGLALLAATADPDLNLREGCNLRAADATDETKLVPRRGAAKTITLYRNEIERFAEDAATTFFGLAGIDFDKKDHLDAIFEKGVADAFLAKSKEEREKISRLGPITAEAIARFEERGKDPFRPVLEALKAAQKTLGKAPGKKAPRVQSLDALKPLAEALRSISEDGSLPAEVIALAAELAAQAREHSDSHEALSVIGKKLKEFKKAAREQQADETPAQ